MPRKRQSQRLATRASQGDPVLPARARDAGRFLAGNSDSAVVLGKMPQTGEELGRHLWTAFNSLEAGVARSLILVPTVYQIVCFNAGRWSDGKTGGDVQWTFHEQNGKTIMWDVLLFDRASLSNSLRASSETHGLTRSVLEVTKDIAELDGRQLTLHDRTVSMDAKFMVRSR